MKTKKQLIDFEHKGNEKHSFKLRPTLLSLCMLTFIGGYSQTGQVNLNLKNATVKELFREIEKQTSYRFSYRDIEINNKGGITISGQGKELKEVLTNELAKQQLSYTVSGNKIIVSPLNKEGVSTKEKKVTGRVLDTKGEPVIGATIMEKGTTNGTITDFDGNFTLNVSDNSMLEVSYVGYQSQGLKAISGKNLTITLKEDTELLDEVVVVGYGTQKKVNLTGSVSSVGSKDFAGIPGSNVTSMLQGKLPGVAITQTSGLPGRENTSIKIRGVGTMNNSDPMIIVDGLEVSSMNDINPNDIENISVLKDAAASSIYGTRAANGVILVTTKRGKAGKTRLTYNGYVGTQKLINQPEFLSSWEYASLLNEAYRNENATPIYDEKDIQLFKDGSSPETHPNTNWSDALFQGTGLVHSHNLNLSGGSEDSKFSISLGYYNQAGLIKRTDYERYNVRTNFDTKIGKRLNFGLSTSLSYGKQQMPTGSTGPAKRDYQDNLYHLFDAFYRSSSVIKNRYEDGSYGHYSDAGNPVAMAEIGGLNIHKTITANGSSFLEYKIIEGLSIKGLAGVTYKNEDANLHFKEITYNDGYSIGPNSVSNRVTQDLNVTLQAFLNYEKTIDSHNIKGMFGVSREETHYRFISAFRKNMPNGELTDIDAGSTSGWENSGRTVVNKIGSYFGRVNYDYAGKYLFEANLRADGSSKFVKKHRWGVFPSFSAGWRLSEEKFMKKYSGFIDNIKIRASWGQLGNHRIGDYVYMNLIELGNIYNFDGDLINGAAQLKSSNPNITWETTTEFDVGFDFNFMNSLIYGSFDYYNRYTDDILTVVPISYTFGLDAPVTNAGAMRNKGFEISLGHKYHINNFSYGIDGYIAINNNKVEKFPNPSTGDMIKKEGIEWNSYYGYKCIGKFQNKEEVQTLPKHDPNVGVGDLKFADISGKDGKPDGKIDAYDRVVLGNMIPKITYGLYEKIA